MKLNSGKYFALVVLSLLAISCSKVPRYVIQPDDMATLLADIHIGESVIDLNRSEYRTDSQKQVLFQSVLREHDVTSEKFDTSLYWYSHNLSYYMEVYDKTIEQLERRIAETGNRIAAENISIAGDSVDIWNGATHMTIGNLSPSRFITFSIANDQNAEPGDSYTWRAKFTNNNENSLWGISANYNDGSREIISSELSGDGWQELYFICDSTKSIDRIYGYLSIPARGNTSVWIDSIMLVRNRLSLDTYNRHYRQQRISPL